MNLENIDLLKKIIEIQACIIQGRGLRAILHLDQYSWLNFSKAKIITICVVESEKMYMEHIFEKDKIFEHNIKEYLFQKKNFKCNSIIRNYEKCLPKNKTHYISESFYDVYKSALSKKEAEELKHNVSMQEFVIMPIYDIEFKKRISYITFIFDKKDTYEIEKLKELKLFFEALIQPMYDSDKNILFPRCVRIDRYFHTLSKKEKTIIKRVLKGE